VRPHLLLRPTGFLLVLMCFALPFLAVSCDSSALKISATYSGYDFVTGAEPAVAMSGLPQMPSQGADNEKLSGVRVLAVLAFALVIAGAVLVSVLRRRPRLWAGGAAALLAAVTLAVNQFTAHQGLADSLQKSVAQASRFAEDAPTLLPGLKLDAAGLVHTRYGFWLTLALLILIALYYAGRITWGYWGAKALQLWQSGPPGPGPAGQMSPGPAGEVSPGPAGHVSPGPVNPGPVSSGPAAAPPT
jgi:hypothetical protein